MTALQLAIDYASLKNKIRQLSEAIFFYGDGVWGEETYPLSHYEQELEAMKTLLAVAEEKLSSINV